MAHLKPLHPSLTFPGCEVSDKFTSTGLQCEEFRSPMSDPLLIFKLAPPTLFCAVMVYTLNGAMLIKAVTSRIQACTVTLPLMAQSVSLMVISVVKEMYREEVIKSCKENHYWMLGMKNTHTTSIIIQAVKTINTCNKCESGNGIQE